MSSVSNGLASGLCAAPWAAGPCPPTPMPLVESTMAGFANCGLWLLSPELERFGLRSSSERERLIGRGWGVVTVAVFRWFLLDAIGLFGLLLEN